jgi:hypothetical protein
MRRVEITSALIVILSVTTAICACRPKPDAAPPTSLVERSPEAFVDWTSIPKEFDPGSYGIEADADYVAAEYASPVFGTLDYLAVTGYDLGSLADPELNLRSQGWKVGKTKTKEMGPPGDAGACVAFSTLTKGPTAICIAYWFSSVGRGTPGITVPVLRAEWRGLLTGRKRGPICVYRVAATVVSDEEEAENSVATFVDELLEEMAGRQ